jgi:hypothetical protein
MGKWINIPWEGGGKIPWVGFFISWLGGQNNMGRESKYVGSGSKYHG